MFFFYAFFFVFSHFHIFTFSYYFFLFSARCVVFNGTKKHDGVSFRDLLPGEYTQMSGRAGRRGLDTVGTVLVTAWGDKLPEVTDLHRMLKGKATKLSSQFRLTYTMILILLRVEEMSVEEMMKRSFTEFNTQSLLGSKNLPSLREKICTCLKRLEKKNDEEEGVSGFECTLCGSIGSDVQLFNDLLRKENEWNGKLCMELGIGFKRTTRQPSPHEKVLLPEGRLVVVRCAVPGGRSMLSNAVAVVLKTSGETLTVVALCDEGMDVPESAELVVIGGGGGGGSDGSSGGGSSSGSGSGKEETKDGSSSAVVASFMPGTYRRLCDTSVGSGNVLLVMLELPYTKIVRICQKTFDVDVVVPKKKKTTTTTTTTSRSWTKVGSKTAASKKISMSPFESAMHDKDNASNAIGRFLTAIHAEGKGRLPMPLDLRSLNIHDMKVVSLMEELETTREMLESHPCHGCSRCTAARRPIERMALLRDKLHHIDRVLSNQNLSLFPDFHRKLNVLRHLEYTSTKDSVVQLKGRVACEINTCDELILTELVFENILEPLTTVECAALLSSFVFQQRGVDDAPELNNALSNAKFELERICGNVCAVQMKHGIELDPHEYMEERLNFGLMHVVYEWARGVTFGEIMELTIVEEGTIVRAISRLDETLREVRNIARIIGDATLYHKMEEASSLIKRDIVFANSLYL